MATVIDKLAEVKASVKEVRHAQIAFMTANRKHLKSLQARTPKEWQCMINHLMPQRNQARRHISSIIWWDYGGGKMSDTEYTPWLRFQKRNCPISMDNSLPRSTDKKEMAKILSQMGIFRTMERVTVKIEGEDDEGNG